jgi:hypothetical protein
MKPKRTPQLLQHLEQSNPVPGYVHTLKPPDWPEEGTADHLLVAADMYRDNPTTVNLRFANCCARRVLVCAARRIVGGYYIGSIEDQAVELLLKIAQEIPL